MHHVSHTHTASSKSVLPNKCCSNLNFIVRLLSLVSPESDLSHTHTHSPSSKSVMPTQVQNTTTCKGRTFESSSIHDCSYLICGGVRFFPYCASTCTIIYTSMYMSGRKGTPSIMFTLAITLVAVLQVSYSHR